MAVFAVALGVAVLSKSSTDSAEHVFAEVPRAFYVSYVDDANDDRSWQNYARLNEALGKLDHGKSPRLSVEFVQVVVGGQPSIDDLLHQLVNEQPVAIIATSDDVLQAAKAATTSVPILFMSYADPVSTGEVKSIAIPGVNRTGFTFHVPMVAKVIELLIEAYPGTKRIGILVDSAAKGTDHWQEIEQARREFGVTVDIFVADNARELESVLRQTRTFLVDAWYVPRGAALWHDQASVIAMMAATRKPVLYDHVAFVRDGGLMAYEAQIPDPFSTWANQLLMIAHGTDVSSIPVERPSRFDFAINLDKVRADPQLRPTKRVLRRANVLIGAPDHDI